MAVDPALKSTPTADLVQKVISTVQGLLDKQVELVKQELREDIGQVAGAARSLGIGIALLLVSLICFFNFLFLAIDRFLPRWGWLAALVCTGLFALIGIMMVMKGKGQVKIEPLARTRETLKEDAEWVQHPLTPNGKSSLSETISPDPFRS